MTTNVLDSEQQEAVRQAQEAAAELKQRYRPLDENHKDFLFREARSQNGWLDKPVEDSLIKELYELTKMGSTSMNCCPARFIFVRTPEGKERLKPALAEGNVDKVTAAPVIAIIGHDMAFYEQMPKLFPHRDVRPLFTNNPELTSSTAFRNGTLQGAYMMLAARALGLDCGPMSGFNNQILDDSFFAGTQVNSNFLCCLGHGDHSKLFQRLPRFELDDVCQFI